MGTIRVRVEAESAETAAPATGVRGEGKEVLVGAEEGLRT